MQISLTVIEGPHQGQVFTFGGHDTFLVGRSKHAHFRLPHKDKYFSRIHFLMEMNPPRCRIVDMASRNGTHVNGKKITTADLKDGDRITAGHTVLRVAVSPGAGETVVTSTARTASAGAAQPVKGYHILQELGRGSMGVVHLAKRDADNTLVALKIIEPAMAASREQLEQFVREASILLLLEHPNIVKFHDLGESAGRLFFAMEYVQGSDAGQMLQKSGLLPIDAVVGLASQVLKALEFAHARHFLHRDIKPSNLLVAKGESGGKIKLADFGLARIYASSPLSGLTLTGALTDSVGFMAPEQITRFRDPKPEADQYATAATLYFLLTGKYPQDVPRKKHTHITKILTDPTVPIRQRRPEVPEALAAVIHKALSRDPRERFADVKEFRQALSKTK